MNEGPADLMDEFLADLNDEQRAAVQHVGGPLLVIAGPGTGKTRVLTRRLAYRVGSGVAPDRLLAITFTNRAADEMKGRVRSLISSDAVRIGTFHWVCSALLRRYIHHLGYNRSFRLLGPAEARHVLRDVL
jgi:DNA helicase-2/ATP-dependent DNA helicase PcrA